MKNKRTPFKLIATLQVSIDDAGKEKSSVKEINDMLKAGTADLTVHQKSWFIRKNDGKVLASAPHDGPEITVEEIKVEEPTEIQRILARQWTTFDGRKTTFGEMDQQHLSNIFYYFKYVRAKYDGFSRTERDKALFAAIDMVLDERFNGQLLPYRPHASFREEIVALNEMGMIKGDKITASRSSDKVIGEFILMEQFVR